MSSNIKSNKYYSVSDMEYLSMLSRTEGGGAWLVSFGVNILSLDHSNPLQLYNLVATINLHKYKHNGSKILCVFF